MGRKKKVLGVIPARYGSNRLPGKPLADIAGKPMIQWVYERAMSAELDGLVVATDDQRIVDVVKAFGGDVVMTSMDHVSGTARMCEVEGMKRFEDYDYFINIQGDQPLIEEYTIRMLSLNLVNFKPNEMAVLTLVASLKKDEINNPSVAKVVTDKNGRALYFSRSAIPYTREGDSVSHFYTDFLSKKSPYLKHLGVYGFTKKTIDKVRGLETSYLEETEKLEQLTWLYEGIPVYTAFGTDVNKISVDTQEDLDRVRKIVEKREKVRS
jgi:3-deoxy-manno-octulosonate cytidylyltransferase (CMP-KDO synthetase)